jgi:hypothetical protein
MFIYNKYVLILIKINMSARRIIDWKEWEKSNYSGQPPLIPLGKMLQQKIQKIQKINAR